MNTTITDAIAIKILNTKSLLIGLGNELHLHTDKCGRLLLKLHGKIHGIEYLADKVLVYGVREFVLIDLRQELQFKIIYRAHLTDWISAGIFLQNASEFVLLTAHSVLLHFAFEEGNERCAIIEKSSCADKSLLYCAKIHGTTWSDLVVFGGNAFGELLIWQPTQLVDGEQKALLLQRLVAHNGVIFSIDYDKCAKLVITTSDDRSIKFWSVMHAERDWKNAVLAPLASGYGHVARVFNGKIIHHRNELFAITVGEDSYFCIWRSTGELVYKRRHQFGATIWNLDYDMDTRTLYTVGSTGNLLAHSLDDLQENNQQTNVCVMVSANPTDSSEYISKVKFISSDFLIGVTNKNRLIFRRDLIDAQQRWIEVVEFRAYKTTVFDVYENLVVLCGFKQMTLFEWDCVACRFVKHYDGEILQGVVRAFQFLNGNDFLASDEHGNCLMLHGKQLLQRLPIELPKCKERWLTSALAVSDDFLLMSNRLGNVMLYQKDKLETRFVHKTTLKRLHGNLGATVFKLVSLSEKCAFITSAGRDGSLKMLYLKRDAATLNVCSRTSVPIVWIEAIITDDALCAPLLLGFNDNHFVAWSKTHDIVMQLPCGGGHRFWHYYLYEDKRSKHQWIQLAFIKNKKLLFYRLKLYNQMVAHVQLPPRNTWHVKACNIAVLLEPQKSEQHETVLISAGEDNLIKISTHNQETNCVLEQADVQTHISNVRALKVLKLNEKCLLIFSGGGRAQLCVSKLYLDNFCVHELVNYMLQATVGQKSCSFDPETRIMAIDVGESTNDNGVYSVYLGCSDGFVRKLLLNSSNNTISLETAIYYGRCVLQVRLVANNRYLLTAATDGILRFHDLSLTQILLQIPQHSNGVNALDTLYDASSDELHVLTGGDDQAVTYTKLKLTLDHLAKPNVVKTQQWKNLHTAQVTAACLAWRDDQTIFAVTSGVDQIIYKFDLITLQAEGVFSTCVADVKGMCVDRSQTQCFIYGSGLQVCTLQSNS